MIKNVYYRRQRQLWSVFIKLAPWLRPQRHVSFPSAARRMGRWRNFAACLWQIPSAFSLVSVRPWKKRMHATAHVRPGCSFFIPGCLFSGSDKWLTSLSERRCSIAHIWDCQGWTQILSPLVFCSGKVSHLRRPIASDTARTLFMLLYAPANRNPTGVIF